MKKTNKTERKSFDANLNCHWNGSNSSLTAKSACDRTDEHKKYAGWNELKLFGRKNCWWSTLSL